MKIKEIFLGHTRIHLLAEKALFIPGKKTLMIADWHLGKAPHFRKAGIFIPAVGLTKELAKMQYLIQTFEPHTVVFLGDLFHSSINSDWLPFCSFLEAYPSVRFILTKGNHDIIPEAVTAETGMEVMEAYSPAPGLYCSHYPKRETGGEIYNIAGHIHPGCIIRTQGRQRFRLPCFHYSGQTLLLPAFGELTGLHISDIKKGDRIFPILSGKIIEWQHEDAG